MTEKHNPCIKLLFGDQKKRINENVSDLNSLRQKVGCICSLDPVDPKLRLFHISESNTRTEITNNQDLNELLSKENSYCLKIQVEVSDNETDGVFSVENDQNIDLENVNDNFYLIHPKEKEEERRKKISREFLDTIFNTEVATILPCNGKSSSKKELATSFLFNDLGKDDSKISSENFHNVEKASEAGHQRLRNYQQPEYQISSNQNLMLVSNVSKPDIELDNQNNLKFTDSQYEFVNLGNYQVIPPVNSVFNDICSICSRNIYYIKYICCICTNASICEKCEELHFHPMIKYKQKELSTKEDVLGFMKEYEKRRPKEEKSIFKKAKDFSEKVFDKKIKLRLLVFSDSFNVRPNKKFRLPITLSNKGKAPLPDNSNLIVLARNNKDLQISPLIVDSPIPSNGKLDVIMECQSTEQLKVYDFEIVIYSSSFTIDCDPIRMKIEVNNDQEEETMNQFFGMYPKIHAIKKEEKGMMMYVINENISVKHPYVIYNILCQYDWSLEAALGALTGDNESV